MWVFSSGDTEPFVEQEQLQTNHCSNEVFLLQLTGLAGDHWKPPGPFCTLPGTRDFHWIPPSHLRLDSSGNFLVVLLNKKRQRENLQPQHHTPDLVCVELLFLLSVFGYKQAAAQERERKPVWCSPLSPAKALRLEQGHPLEMAEKNLSLRSRVLYLSPWLTRP